MNIAIQSLCSDRTIWHDCHWVGTSRSCRLSSKILCMKQQMDTRQGNMLLHFFTQGKDTVCLLLINDCVLVTTFIKIQIYVHSDQFCICFPWSGVVAVSFAMQMQCEIDGSQVRKLKSSTYPSTMVCGVWFVSKSTSVKTDTYHCYKYCTFDHCYLHTICRYIYFIYPKCYIYHIDNPNDLYAVIWMVLWVKCM